MSHLPRNSFHLLISVFCVVLLSVIQPGFALRGSSIATRIQARPTARHIIALKVSTRQLESDTVTVKKVSASKISEPVSEPELISSTDTILYGLLATIQLLPPLALVHLPEPLDSIRRPVSYLYFIVSATILVILGAKRQDIQQGPQQKPITLQSAALAPLVSSAVIFTIYLLLKYTDIEIYFDRVYQLLGESLAVFPTSILISTSTSTSQALFEG